jgi:hypothetical protein
MTRQDILDNYDVNEHGIICSPGKFEGEMLYVPYFWDLGMNGCADEDEDGVWTFTIMNFGDRVFFPELGNAKVIRLEESEQGFVYSAVE